MGRVSPDGARRIRVEKWVTSMSQPTMRRAFQRNRNAYAELLLHCVRTRRFREPLDRLPPRGPLPRLPAHLALDRRARASLRQERFWQSVLSNRRDGSHVSGPDGDHEGGQLIGDEHDRCIPLRSPARVRATSRSPNTDRT